METSNLRLGEILIDAGVISAAQLKTSLELQKARQLRLGMILLQEQIVTEAQLIQALSRRLSIPWVSLWHLDIEDALLELVPASVAEEFFLIPIYIRTTGVGEKALYVAMNDPMDESALRFVAASAGMSVKPMIAAPSDIAAAIRIYYYDEEILSEDPLPPVPLAAGTSKPAPPPVKSAPTKMGPPPAPGFGTRDLSAPPPPPQEESVEEIEEIEEIDSVAPDAATPETEEVVDTATDETQEETSEEMDAEAAESLTSRDIEKHMFGVGKGGGAKGISMTLLDGTRIQFGAATQSHLPPEAAPSAEAPAPKALTKESLIEGLRAAAAGEPMDGTLPSTRWEPYMAALLDVLFKKHLIFFDEFMKALKK